MLPESHRQPDSGKMGIGSHPSQGMKGRSAALKSSRRRFIAQAGLLFLATALFALMLGAAFSGGAHTARAEAGRPAQALTGYPVEGETPGINETLISEQETVTALVGQPTPTPASLLETSTATITPTAEPTKPNLFGTENAEMGAGKVTPPPSETPAPTMTAYRSPTPTQGTASPVSDSGAGQKPGLNWPLFWLGFSFPVLAGCGYVLYLLDHRPELFRPRPKV